jgi:hypothetical protein
LSPAAIRAELEPFLGDQIISIGEGAGGVINVGLRATGEELAGQLHATYGDAVRISVGLFPFPPPENPQRACVNIREVVRDHAPLLAAVAVDRTIDAGTFFRGTVRLTNAGILPFQLETSSNFSVHLFRPGESEPIGGSEGGMVGTGYSAPLDPGEAVELEAAGGTASCDLALGYLLPAGVYEARAIIDFQTATGELAFFWSDPATVELINP